MKNNTARVQRTQDRDQDNPDTAQYVNIKKKDIRGKHKLNIDMRKLKGSVSIIPKEQSQTWERVTIPSQYVISVEADKETGGFIVVADLSKLFTSQLETLEKEIKDNQKVMAHIVGTKRVETPYITMEDVLACIDKLKEKICY